MLTNGKNAIVESEMTLEEMAIDVCESPWTRSSETEVDGLVFTNHIVGIEVQDNE